MEARMLTVRLTLCFAKQSNSPSFFIPALRHFRRRQYRHWFRLSLSIRQFRSNLQAYWLDLRTLLLKKPWKARVGLSDRSRQAQSQPRCLELHWRTSTYFASVATRGSVVFTRCSVAANSTNLPDRRSDCLRAVHVSGGHGVMMIGDCLLGIQWPHSWWVVLSRSWVVVKVEVEFEFEFEVEVEFAVVDDEERFLNRWWCWVICESQSSK